LLTDPEEQRAFLRRLAEHQLAGLGFGIGLAHEAVPPALLEVAEELEFPSLIKARVWDAVRHEQPSWRTRLLAGWGARLALPLAAATSVK